MPRPQTVSLLVEALSLVSPDRERFLGSAFAARAPTGEIEVPAPRAAPARLPTPPDMLIEREREEAAVAHLLGGGARLVTLTGPGGVGKTRLAIQVASGLQTSYADGAAFVDLSALRDAALVPSTVAHALGLHERGPRNGRALLLERLSGKHLLLVLDNLEQVLEAATLVAALIDACPSLAILATSRAPLRLRAEQQFPVTPLSVPARDLSSLGELPGYGAVQLFVARAQLVQPSFALTEENAAAVAEICRRLDGVTLAIELAAARARLLPPHALVSRLDRRLAVLVGGPARPPGPAADAAGHDRLEL
jgi:predicted ATPase